MFGRATLPVGGSQRLGVTIVKAENLTEEKRAEMEKARKVGRMVVTEKQRDVMHKDAMAPTQAAAAVAH